MACYSSPLLGVFILACVVLCGVLAIMLLIIYSIFSSSNFSKGHIDISRFLIEECHASVNATDNNGFTPLHNACW